LKEIIFSEFEISGSAKTDGEGHKDGKSHTGSCVVIGDVGAVHCRSTKQEIVVRSSTWSELVGVSNALNQGLDMREFHKGQGYKMGLMILYRDNLSCIAMLARGRPGAERTRHIAIRYYWTKECVNNGEVKIIHKGNISEYLNETPSGCPVRVLEDMPDRMISSSRRQDSRLILRENDALWGQNSSIDMESS
jgi:hypothetical protein